MTPDGAPSRPREDLFAYVRFVGEQDGPVERELKEHLTTLFRSDPAILIAYLARVQYDNTDSCGVALCLVSMNPDDKGVWDRVGRVLGHVQAGCSS